VKLGEESILKLSAGFQFENSYHPEDGLRVKRDNSSGRFVWV
jgi:hypothetical protein